jgi:inosose dehydratase
VEFADDPRNPPWARVLDDARAADTAASSSAIGFMRRGSGHPRTGAGGRGLTLVGGVVFRPFHDPDSGTVFSMRHSERAARKAHGARRLVLIDSIAATRPRPRVEREAPWLEGSTSTPRPHTTVATLGSEEFGLDVTFHAHAGGYVEFEDELDRVIDRIAPEHLGVCLDTGHSLYAGFDPVAFYRQHADRVTYIHLKDIDPQVRERVIRDRIGFYDACGARLFCNLGDGSVDFAAFREALESSGYGGWATVEQDCDRSQFASRGCAVNLAYLQSVGLA